MRTLDIVLRAWLLCMSRFAPREKNSCFWKCGWREKSLPGRPQIYFFNRFSEDILFSFLVSLLFLYSCFFFLFSFLFIFYFLIVCLFFEIKNIYSDKKKSNWTTGWITMILLLNNSRFIPLSAVVYQSGTFIRLYHIDCAFNIINLLPLQERCLF